MAQKIIWNWQQKDWPHFTYDLAHIADLETEFLKKAGESFGIAKHLSNSEKRDITIQMITNEALKTSEIEGEILDRESLQSSIKKHFGLKVTTAANHPAEDGIADMMIDLYHHYEIPLTHEILWTWHAMLMNGRRDLHSIGSYRTHIEPMQVVSGYLQNPTIHFEAPPSQDIKREMDGFIEWFNKTAPSGSLPLPALVRSSIAHLYFESIHPFEDGNGRIGRALVEKILAQHLNHPALIALSQIINDRRKMYYDALGAQSKHNHINGWLQYFAETILKAQQYAIDQLDFIIKKTKFFDKFKDQMNNRQHKAVARMMREGIKGFEGGLSAQNYMAITQASASTATRDLQDLVDKEILIQTGTLKGARYWLHIP
jgi:Fic family protein